MVSIKAYNRHVLIVVQWGKLNSNQAGIEFEMD